MSIILTITGYTLLDALIWVVAAAVIYFILNWAIKYIGVEEPFNKVCRVIIAIIVVVFLLNAIFTLVGKPFIQW